MDAKSLVVENSHKSTMKWNKLAFGPKRGKVKNEAIELRQRLESNQHYNIFVGDDRYKTNFWLNFK